METGGRRILKVQVASEPVVLKGKDTLEHEAEAAGRGLIETARKEAERIRKITLESAQKERALAKAEAERLVREAEEKRDALIAEEARKAREGARAEVLKEFRPRIEEAVQTFERVVREAEQAWRGSLLHHRNEVVELALGIAERVVRKIQSEDKELVARVAERALELARDRQEVILRVNPEDLEILEEFQEKLFARFEDVQTMKVLEDRRVDRGGVWIETPSGFVDARISRQLEEILDWVLPREERVEEAAEEEIRFSVDEVGADPSEERGEEEA